MSVEHVNRTIVHSHGNLAPNPHRNLQCTPFDSFCQTIALLRPLELAMVITPANSLVTELPRRIRLPVPRPLYPRLCLLLNFAFATSESRSTQIPTEHQPALYQRSTSVDESTPPSSLVPTSRLDWPRLCCSSPRAACRGTISPHTYPRHSTQHVYSPPSPSLQMKDRSGAITAITGLCVHHHRPKRGKYT